jgi:hypothetical protein
MSADRTGNRPDPDSVRYIERWTFRFTLSASRFPLRELSSP